MDGKDLAILRELRKDGKGSLTEISKNTGIPLSTVHDRFADLEDFAVHKHTLLLDLNKLGFPIRRQYIFKAENQRLVLELLHNNHFLNNCSIAEGKRFCAEMVFPSEHSAFAFEESLKSCTEGSIMTISLLSELKKEALIP